MKFRVERFAGLDTSGSGLIVIVAHGSTWTYRLHSLRHEWAGLVAVKGGVLVERKLTWICPGLLVHGLSGRLPARGRLVGIEASMNLAVPKGAIKIKVLCRLV
jgi:hypothetical protein